MKNSRSLFSQLIIGTFLLNLLPQIALAETRSFSDVETVNHNYTAIEYLAEQATLEGYSDGSFLPENTVNRAELMKILVAGQGIEPDEDIYQNCFPDVTTEWYARYVCYAEEQGWVSGYPDGTFLPANAVSNVEAMKMLINSQGLGDQVPETVDTQLFSDIDNEQWYAGYVYVAQQYNLLEETGAYYAPGSEMNRGGISENLFRTLAIFNEETVEAYDRTAYNNLLNDADLSELIHDKVLIIADSYTIDTDGAFSTDDYHDDEDGIFSLESYTESAQLVVSNSYELDASDDTAEIVVTDYTLDTDGNVSLAEYEDREEELIVIFIVESTLEGETGNTEIDGEDFDNVTLEDIQNSETPEEPGDDDDNDDGDDDGDDDEGDDDGDDSGNDDDGDTDGDDGFDDSDNAACLDYYKNVLLHTVASGSTYRCEWSTYEGTAKYVFDYFEDYTYDTSDEVSYGTRTNTEEVYLETTQTTEYEYSLIYINVDSYQPVLGEVNEYYWKDLYEYLIIDDITGIGTYTYDYSYLETEETPQYDGINQIETIERTINNTSDQISLTQINIGQTEGIFYDDYAWEDDSALLEEVEGAKAFNLSVSLDSQDDYPSTEDFYTEVISATTATYTDSVYDDQNYSTYDEDTFDIYFNTTVQIRDEWANGAAISGSADYSSDTGCDYSMPTEAVGTCHNDVYAEWDIWPTS
jgi:hypothetical protein